MSVSKYVQEAVRNVKNEWLASYSGRKWPRRAVTPFVKDYLPKLDISEELNPEEANTYQLLTGIV